MGVWYATREDVKAALDSKITARDDAQVDRANEAAARNVEACLHRVFYPQVATRYFDWPNHQYARAWRLWLDADELVSATTITTGGVAIPASDYFLEPVNTGPPYTRVEIDLGSSAAFGRGPTHQRDIAITGLFGYRADETPAGTLAEDLDLTETDVDVTDGSLVGVGSILRADNERMIVTGRTWISVTTLAAGPIGATTPENLLVLADGSRVHAGEQILVEAERMLVTDVIGGFVTVKRAVDGTAINTHANGTGVAVSQRLTVTRGALGTTAATHSTSAPLFAHVVPGPVKALAVAEAVCQIEQERAAYARTAGSGDNERETAGRGLSLAREAAWTACGRKARTRAI